MEGTSVATDASMERFLQYVLAHPERFERSEVPCAIADLWQDALDGVQFSFPRVEAHFELHSAVSKPSLLMQ
jgi:hypothetical protein